MNFKKSMGHGLLAMTMVVLAPLARAQNEDRFDIERFVVEGNSLLPKDEVEALVRPFTGKSREYGDVQRALEALELRYRERGYSAVQVHVPEQELGSGQVRISVTEASIRRIRVQGGKFFDEANVRQSLPAIREGAFPNAVTFSENVQLANENPARQVEVVLKGTDQEGIIDVEIEVTDSSPLKFSASMDDTGNKQTGKHRISAGIQYANLFNRDHVVSLNYGTALEKPELVSIYSLGYRIPLYSLGDSIDFIIAKSDVDAGVTDTVAGPLTFSGKGDVYGARYNWLFPRRGEYTHRVVFGLDLKQFKNTCAIGGAAICGAAGVDVTVRPWSVTYSGQWAGPGSQTEHSWSYTRNWPGADKGKAADVAAARPSPTGGNGASASFDVFKASFSHLRALEGDWQVRVAASGQYAKRPLLSGEQFGIGGTSSVRGFAEREVSRDTGYFGNLELYSPNLAGALGMGDANVRVLGFYDFGYASSIPLEGEVKQKSAIAGAGIGLRVAWQKSLSFKFDFAQVVDEGGNQLKGSHRSQFSLAYSF